MRLAFLLVASLFSSVTPLRQPSTVSPPIRKQPFESRRIIQHHQVTHKQESSSIISIVTRIRGGYYSNDTSSDTISKVQESTSSNNNNNSTTMKQCRCVLCGQEILAESQADCEAHMAVCPAFARVHPQDGSTNPDGVYPPGSEPSGRTTTTPNVEELQDTNESDVDVYSMSVKELKRIITNAGLSFADCIEKSDLQARAEEALNR